MSELKYHEIANIFPLMQGDEYEALKQDIAANGLREAIWLHPDGSIIDGRNRYRACVDAGVEPKFRRYDGNEPLSFVISMNLQRRHLTSEQRAMLAADVLPMLEVEAKQRQATSTGGANPQLSQKIDQAEKGKATQQAAKTFKTNRQYVSDAKKVKAKSPELAEQVRQGKTSLKDAKREIKKQEKEEAKQAVLDLPPTLVWDGQFRPNVIAVADIAHIDLPANSIDMIFTDPPYHDEYIDLYGYLAILAAHCLKPGGYLMTYAGKMFLPQIHVTLGSHLEYISEFAVFHPFSQSRIMKHNIFENWRPILAYKKPGRTAVREWVQDVIRGERNKEHHDWQQDEQAPLAYIEAYTKPGDLILDPFCGGGTTPAACQKIKRHYLAFDKDEHAVRKTIQRLQAGLSQSR